MINFYNYFNFFFFNKKNIFNVLKNIWLNKYFKSIKNILIFSVFLNSSKLDIKLSIKYFIGLEIFKINTNTIKNKNKKIKKAYIFFVHEFI